MTATAPERCPQCVGVMPPGVRFCPSCGRPSGDSTLAERKLVTVLFADISGSTSLGERMDPERWRAMLQRYFSLMAAVIEGWGGTVQKFIGDAIMAAFGAPVIREDDAERAIRAAFEMLDRLQDLNRDFQSQHGVQLAIRIGVNTGDVMAASDQLIVTGDAVNVAARLEQAAEPGTILVGDRTYAATSQAFVFGPPIEREVRGKSAPVTARQALRPVMDALERRVGLQVAIVGRDAELLALDTLLAEAIESRSPRMALIYGPAGIGKSRLVREFLNLASSRYPESRVLHGRCQSAGRGMTYWALGDMLRRDFGIALDDQAQVAQERLRAQVETVLKRAQLSRAEVDHTIHALALTSGIRLPDNPLDLIRPRAVESELSLAWPRFMSALAAPGPAIVVVEDLHWAGEQLLTMLEHLVARSAGPVVLVATARPEFSSDHPNFAAGRDDVAVVALRRLSDQQSAVVIDEMLGGGELPPSLQAELIATAEGNPLFLEELIRRLMDLGAIGRRDGQWQVTAAAAHASIPDTVHALLAARIDALSPGQKRALQEASVIGRVFWEEPLARATGDPDITKTLLALERHGLISVRPTSTMAGQLEFALKHALVRDVAYASLSRARRARAHAEVARWLEEVAGDRADEVAELIAYHYRIAVAGEDADLAWIDDPEGRVELRRRAFPAILSAGNLARQRFAIDKAVELHTEALKLAVDAAERAVVLEAIGDDHEAAFHGDDAVPAWRSALAALSDQPATSGARVRIALKCAKTTGIRWGGFKVTPPLRQVDDFIDEGLAANPDPPSRGWLLAIRAYAPSQSALVRETDPHSQAERVRAGEEGLAVGREVGDVDLQVVATRALAGLAMLAGDYRRAVELTRMELRLVDQIVASRERALALFFVGLRLMDIEGGYEEGLVLGRRSYALAKELSLHEVMHATHLLMYGNLMLRRWTEIDVLLDEHLDALRKEADMSCPYVRGGPFFGAAALAWRGDVGRAREVAALVPLDHDVPGLPEALAALVKLACGDALAARQEAEHVIVAGRAPMYGEASFETLVMLDALVALRDADGLRKFLPIAQQRKGALAPLPAACDRAEATLRALESEGQMPQPAASGPDG